MKIINNNVKYNKVIDLKNNIKTNNKKNTENKKAAIIDISNSSSIAKYNIEASQNQELKDAEKILRTVKNSINENNAENFLNNSNFNTKRIYELLNS